MLTIVDAFLFSVAALTNTPACLVVVTVSETRMKRRYRCRAGHYSLGLNVTRTLPAALQLSCMVFSWEKNSSTLRRTPE